MIRHLLVRDVLSLLARHMARSAVRILGMMAGGENRMTREAFASIKTDANFGVVRRMRIVTSRAGEPVPACAPARALQQRFPLARGAASRTGFPPILEIDSLVEQVGAGAKRAETLPRADDGDLSFEMALEANRVAQDRIELRRIDDGPLAMFGQMVRRIAVAGGAENPSPLKR